MKEHSILFNTAMVRAILAGRKTQTRRIVKPQPDTTNWKITAFDKPKEWRRQPMLGPSHHGWYENMWVLNNVSDSAGAVPYTGRKCPYGIPGTKLWVRESFVLNYSDDMPVAYKADWYDAITEFAKPPKWKSSIHMSRSASRITLEVLNIRVERMQDITWRDCHAEGISYISKLGEPNNFYDAFAKLWDSINKKRGYGWDVNPWVWVVEFKKI